MRLPLVISWLLIMLALLYPAVLSAGVIELAHNKPVTASGEFWPATYAVDGNIDSLWNGGAHGAWIQVDLEAIFSLSRIVLWGYNVGAYSNTFSVYAGETEGALVLVGSIATPGPGWTSGGPFDWNYWTDWMTPGLSARYVRVAGDPAGRDWAAFSELEVFGDDQGGAIPEPSAFVLTAAGLGALATRARRRKEVS